MNWLETRIFKIISAIVLFLFCWTFTGYQVAYAVKNNEQQSALSDQQQKKKTKRAEEKLQEALDDIEKIIEEVEKLGSLEDKKTKKKELIAKKQEINEFDKEIREQFKATEQKLKDAGLPQEILKRHHDFVKLYEKNFKELNTNLDEIDSAKTEIEIDDKVEKTKKFLKKVKPPKKHTPLDPNKLPHRTPEPVSKKPRLNKKEFLDRGQLSGVPVNPNGLGHVAGSSQGKTKNSIQHSVVSRQKKTNSQLSTVNHEPVLVASNGSLEGLLDSEQLTVDSSQPLDSELLTQNSLLPDPRSLTPILLAQADTPTSADLAETIEVQFTDAIIAKAEELEHKPVLIYNWVRNNIEFVPTYGSIQGADYCLQTKLCNAFDTASLLIALLRVSGIHARYVEGTVEIPIEKVKNWVGGFTDKNSALNLIASGGIPVKGKISGGEIVAVQMEHIYVEAWVDYIPSRGAVHKQGDTWVSMDASFKQYDYNSGVDMSSILSTIGFDVTEIINNAHASATKDEVNLWATSVDTDLIENETNNLRVNLLNYFQTNNPGATINDILSNRVIRLQSFIILPISLPYHVISPTIKFSEVPESLQHKVVIFLISGFFSNETLFSYSSPLATIGSKQLTVSYFPATQDDEATAQLYGGILKTPAYLLHLKAFLKIEGEVRGAGGLILLGETQKLKIQFESPYGITDSVQHDIIAGGYYAIAVNHGTVGGVLLKERQEKITGIINRGQATKDESLGQLLHILVLSYFIQAQMFANINERALDVVNLKLGSEGIVGTSIPVLTIFGIPMQVSFTGLFIDVQKSINAPFAKNGDRERVKSFMVSTGIYGSGLEHSIFEEVMQTEGVSAIKLLRVANDSGVPIHFINEANAATILPQLSLPSEEILAFQNAINAGKIIYTPQQTLSFDGFSGVGYLVLDPETGSGGYVISYELGNLNGGFALLDGLFSSLEPILDEIRDAAILVIGLFSGVIELLLNFLLLGYDIYEAYINGTATLGEVVFAIAVWAAFGAAALYLIQSASAITLAAAILAGAFFGPVGAIVGAVLAIIFIVLVEVAIFFLSNYIIGLILAYWERRREIFAHWSLAHDVQII